MKLLAILFCFLAGIAYAQKNVPFEKDIFKDRKSEFKEAVKSLEQGDKLYEEGIYRYKAAIHHYLKAQEFNPNNDLLNYKIGRCYLYTGTRLKAIPYLEKAYGLNPNISAKIHYYLGWAYHLNLEFDRAIDHYNKYKARLKNDDTESIREVYKRVDECNYGKEYVKKPVRVFIDNIGDGVNTPFPEYGPVISADESVMYFTSRRDNTTGGGQDPVIFEPFEDIYVSYNNGGTWSAAVNLGKPVNSNEHDATVGLSPDGQKLLVYLGENSGDLYECELKGDQWSRPKKLPKTINTDFHEPSASLSYDGKTLYFVSDKPGGSLGGHDIYMSSMDAKGRWGEALNLGPVINTQYDDEAVFMHPDGKTMYFSSKGHSSMGGYDIFKSVFENGKWSEPENMGYPINTPDDDVFFVVSASGKHGYYASFKSDGYGEKDIYLITILGPEKPLLLNTEDNLLASVAAPVSERVIEPVVEVKRASITLLKGVVTDALTQQPLEAAVEIVDNEKNEVIASFLSNSKTGKYLVSLPSGKNYGIAVKKDDYLFHSENFNIPVAAAYQEVNKDVQLKKVAVGSKIVLKNIFFDFDKAMLRPESTAELDRLVQLLNDVPAMRVEISGHTDNKGSESYNQKLSEDRAKSVVEYLKGKGTGASRLEYKGYGLLQPIATNDTDEGRQLNRRTEFKILSR